MTIVKICGITNAEDARHAASSGADLLGFIFADISKRYITPAAAQPIVSAIKDTYPQVKCVGVFVVKDSITPDKMDAACATAGADAAQVVGELSTEFLNELQTPVYASIRPESIEQALAEAVAFSRKQQPGFLPTLHLDAFHPSLYGGTGETASITVAQHLTQHTARLMLSGGLKPGNVAEYVQAVQPWAVDVASGTEASPGKKDPEKVSQFIVAAKNIELEA